MRSQLVPRIFSLPFPLALTLLPLANAAAQGYPAVPEQHPRVFITPSDTAALQIKKGVQEFKGIWDEIVNLSNSHFLPAALVYLLEGNSAKGNWAVNFSDTYPATLIVFDRVAATNASFKKTWQIHAIEEPVIEGSTITIRRTAAHYPKGPSDGEGNYSGKLVVRSLLPSDGIRQKIGGPGYDCWVAYEDTNYAPDPGGSNYDYENGMWRVEVSPGDARAEDLFLHIMTVMDDTTAIGPTVVAIDTEQLTGAKLLDRAVCFSRSGAELDGQVALTIPGSGDVKTLVCGLKPGSWTVAGNDIQLMGLSATEEGKSIYSPVSGGDYVLSRTGPLAARDIRPANAHTIYQNYPNPFNATTTISLELPRAAAQASIVVYDLRGREVVTLMNGPVRPGYHQIIWDGKTSDGLEVPTGIYIARLTVRPAGQARLVTPEYSKSIKMLLPLLLNISRQSCYLVKNIRRDQQD